MTRPDITAALSHHADEAETIMHGEELEMFEPEEIATTETLPEVLTAAQVTTAELARLEKYRGEVLPDVTDRKAALALDEKRKEVKRIRLVAEKICDGEREEAMRTNQKWLGIKGDVCGRLKSVEKHLDDEFERHEEWKRAEAKRIEDEKRASREKRLQQAREADCAASMGDIETMDEAQWSAMIESAKAVQATRLRAAKIVSDLAALGVTASADDAAAMTDDDVAAAIKTAQDAEADRKADEKRKADAKAEADRLERLRLERVAQRVRDLSERGAARRFEEVEAMSDEEFAEAITEADKAVQAEADRKAEEARKIQEEREAMERGSQRFRELSALGESRHTIDELSAMGAEVYAEVLAGAKAAKAKRDEEDAQREREAQAKRDADRKAQEERDEQDRKERDQRERERVEALKPQREAVIAWANSVIVPALPDIADEDLGEVAACAREDIGVILAKLIDRMGGTN